MLGFLPARAVGLEGFRGFFPDAGPGDVGAAGTGPWTRREGFLCVISSFFTFRKPEVIASPLLISANTAATPPPAGLAAGGAEPKSAGGGGGGGGGGPGAGGAPADVAAGPADPLKSTALPP